MESLVYAYLSSNLAYILVVEQKRVLLLCAQLVVLFGGRLERLLLVHVVLNGLDAELVYGRIACVSSMISNLMSNGTIGLIK